MLSLFSLIATKGAVIQSVFLKTQVKLVSGSEPLNTFNNSDLLTQPYLLIIEILMSFCTTLDYGTNIWLVDVGSIMDPL